MAQTRIDKRIERAGRVVGKELGRLVRRLGKEARVAARKGKQMQTAGRKRSIHLLRRTAWALNKVALDLEKSEKQTRVWRRHGKKRSR